MKLKKGFKKTCALVLSCSMIMSAFAGVAANKSVQASGFDYNLALSDSIIYYDAQKSGADAGENNAFSWRDACFEHDGADVGLDLSGGYHDCGDHVKFGITQGYAASVLEWGYYNYYNAYQTSGASTKTLQTLKHFCDYFLKCHPNMFTFYYQVGDANLDHSYWGSPELQEGIQGYRTTVYKADASSAASDVCGESAAALALMSLNYKSIDASYAAQCLTAAKSIYALGKSNLGCGQAQGYYTETSYNDDLAWAAICLYKATGTASYLSDAETCVKDGDSKPKETTWAMCWNDMWLPTEIELYKETQDSTYLNAVKYNVDYWVNDLTTTAGGMKYLTAWGNLRYVAAESLVAMQYYALSNDASAKELAVSQIDYILGDNPNNMSYMIGFGTNYPLHPHQRAANGYQGFENMYNEAKYVLVGGLVGGPDSSDYFGDDVSKWQETEGGIDYNAGLVGALAAIVANGTESHPSQTAETSPSPSVTPTTEVPATTTSTSPSPSVAPTTEVPATTASTSPSPSVAPTTASTSPSPSVAPTTASTSPSPSVAPTTEVPATTASSSPSPSVAPTTTASASDVVPSVNMTVQAGGSVNLNCTIASTGTSPVDLSKLTIRYYYSKDGDKEQNFWCDNAGLQLNAAPYYVNLSSNVKGTFYDGYLEISFTTSQEIATGAGSLNMGIRFAQADWSAFTNFVDNGYKVYYDGVLMN